MMVLKQNVNGRWSIYDGDIESECLSCGSQIDVLIGGHWIHTQIEHSASRGGYYALTPGVRLTEGLPARLSLAVRKGK